MIHAISCWYTGTTHDRGRLKKTDDTVEFKLMIATNLIGFETLPQTLPHYCLESFRRNNKPDALCFKADDTWQRMTGSEAIERVRRIALGLSALGVTAGDRVA